MDSEVVRIEREGPLHIVTICRPDVRNAVDDPTAAALGSAFASFEGDEAARVAILTGEGDTFCSGADLKAVAAGERNQIEATGTAPMGPTRMSLTKPVIAAIEGYAVAGGLELALWCDLRVAAEDAVFGVFSRRFGVPLIDGGTYRLPRLIGQGRALDLILTGRRVEAAEAKSIGLVDRVVPAGSALRAAKELGERVASFPQISLRADRSSVHGSWGLGLEEALEREFASGMRALMEGETRAGAERFASGSGRGGEGT